MTTINVAVTLTPDAGKPSGYQFTYASDSGLVADDGSIDLSSFDKSNVVLVFTLQSMASGQPTYPDPTDPTQAIWFALWPKDAPPPAPCPASSGHANSSFDHFSVGSNGTRLQFTDKNKDNKRYAYALRCIVPSVTSPIADDPIIINK